MATADEEITLLEQEARALRARIRDLEDDDDLTMPSPTPDGDPPQSQLDLKSAQRRLAEMEAELAARGRPLG